MNNYTFKNNYQKISVRLRLEFERDILKTLHRGDEITFTVEKNAAGKHIVKHKGITVQQLDLNDGAPSDDITMPNTAFNLEDTITYKPSHMSGQIIVTDFDRTNIAISDGDGVANKQPAILLQLTEGDTLTSVLSPSFVPIGEMMSQEAAEILLCKISGL